MCACVPVFAGTRYVSGAVLRLIRSYPGDTVVHVISADGATQVGACRGFSLLSKQACQVFCDMRVCVCAWREGGTGVFSEISADTPRAHHCTIHIYTPPQAIGSFKEPKPTYKQLESLIQSAREKKMEIFQIARKASSLDREAVSWWLVWLACICVQHICVCAKVCMHPHWAVGQHNNPGGQPW